jgi:5-methylcytosine-specific restriction endonuclease McrA
MRTRTLNARQKAWKGAKWIHPTTRLAIYLRDNCRCVYCGAGFREILMLGQRVCLDHLRPESRGGSNKSHNLVTACSECNLRRGSKPWREFVLRRGYATQVKRIENRVRRVLPREAALTTIKQWGTPSKYIHGTFS